MHARPPTSRRPTMADVAFRAGVSLKSVSRVVNAEPHVSPDLADRVHRAVDELGYRPDRRARELAALRRAGGLIGFVQVDVANPFFAAVYRGLEDVTRDRGLLVISGSTEGDHRREAALVETLIESRVDGLVVAGAEGSDELLRREVDHGTPVVGVDRLLPALAVDTVVSSNRSSARAAVLHLLERGHERIAYLGGDRRVWTAVERHAGYRDALRDAGRTPDPGLEVHDVGDRTRAAGALRDLLSAPDPPTAVFTGQDRITVGAITALHALGRQHDVALFGFDEIPFSEQLDPTVSVVAQDPYEMGRIAGELLLHRLAGGTQAPPARRVISAPLVHRESGDIRPHRRP